MAPWLAPIFKENHWLVSLLAGGIEKKIEVAIGKHHKIFCEKSIKLPFRVRNREKKTTRLST